MSPRHPDHRPRRTHRRATPPNLAAPKRPPTAATAGPAPAPATPAPTPAPTPAAAQGPTTHWGNEAQWYDQLVGDAGSEFQQAVIFPRLLPMLRLAPGEKVLDVACGQGVLSRLLHQRGGEVTGIDAAASLIDLARRRSDPAIRYLVDDARELTSVPPSHFDAAACVLAIQNMHPLPPVFAAIARVLRPGGRLLLVMMHPCFRGPQYSSWGWDDAGTTQYRRVERYLLPRKHPIITHPGSAPHKYTWTFHRPLQTYIQTLARAGFRIDGLEEWSSHKESTSGPRAPAENLARKEIPLFLALRAVKAAPAPGEQPAR